MYARTLYRFRHNSPKLQPTKSFPTTTREAEASVGRGWCEVVVIDNRTNDNKKTTQRSVIKTKIPFIATPLRALSFIWFAIAVLGR